jgi:hypothetical protein
VKLINVIIIRYNLDCNIRIKKGNRKVEYMIYIRKSSMVKLGEIVNTEMCNSMHYKLKPQIQIK